MLVAPDDAVIAIAAGDYAEQIVFGVKRLRLWGRCPELVSISGGG